MSFRNNGMIQIEFLIKLALTMVVVLIVLALVMRGLAKNLDSTQMETTCRGSIVARNLVKVPGTNMQPTPLICKQQDKTAEFSKLKSREEVEKRISELSARCWWQFGNGGYREILSGLSANPHENYCFTCYYFNLDAKEKVTATELYQYMEKNTYKSVPVESGEVTSGAAKEEKLREIKYLEYIQAGDGYVGIPKDFVMQKDLYAIAYVEPHDFAKINVFGWSNVGNTQLVGKPLIHINTLRGVQEDLNCVMVTDIQGS